MAKVDGSKLRSYRALRRMNQTDLALAAGVSRQTISRIESEHEPNANRPTVEAVSDVLGVRPEDLLAEG